MQFPGGLPGIAFNIDEEEIGVVILGETSEVFAGQEVERTGRVMDAQVGDGLIGSVIDPAGRPLDGRDAVRFERRLPIEREAPAIMDREPVNIPLQTGIKVIDALIPIGRGQRELILGDRQTGKTAIALDTVVNQKDQDVVCIYCFIGQRAAAVASAIDGLRASGAMDYTVVVVTGGNDPPGLKYIAPYAATTIGEFFMTQGRDVLIIYDDLTQHARAYRELSLLLRRPPGREAFPGDIFYIHSRLLERATQLARRAWRWFADRAADCRNRGGEHRRLHPDQPHFHYRRSDLPLAGVVQLGVLPAIDVGKSVSRVGGKAQLPVFHSLAGSLKLAYSQFEEMEIFARFGTRLDENARKIIEHGRRIRACLKQPQFAPVPVSEQIVVLLALTAGLFDEVPLDQMPEAERAVRQTAVQLPKRSCEAFSAGSSSVPRNAKSFSVTRTRRAGLFPSNAMSETVFSLRRKIKGVHELKSVVRTMKAMAAASLGQYEQAAQALELYAGTVERGLVVCLRHCASWSQAAARIKSALWRSGFWFSARTREWSASSTNIWPNL